MNDQRKVIFDQRVEWMSDAVTAEVVSDMRHDVIEDLVHKHVPENAYPEQWDVAGLKEELTRVLSLDLPVDQWAKEEGIADEELLARITRRADEHMAAKVAQWGPDVLRYVEKSILLQTLDHLWREHLVMLEHLRQVIGLRGYGQRDPLNEYKAEAFNLFETMSQSLREGVTAQLMRVEIVQQQPDDSVPELPPMQASHVDPSTGEDELALAAGRRADAGARRHHAEARRRAQSERSVDLGQGRPQRGVPLRLGQEVQALPRAVRLSRSRRATPKQNRRANARRFRFRRDDRSAEARPAAVEVAGRHHRRGAVHRRAGAARRRRAGAGAAARGRRGRSLRFGGLDRLRLRPAWRGSRHARRRWSAWPRASVSARRGRRRLASGVVACAGRPGAPCDRARRRSSRLAWLSADFDANRLPNRLLPLDLRPLARAWSRQWPSRAARPRPRRPASAGAGDQPARRRARGCAAAAPSAGMVPGGVETRKLGSCGATPIWFFFTASTNTGCMPPSALVLIGAIAILRRLRSANCMLVLRSLSRTSAGDLFRHLVRRALAGRAERQRAPARRLRRRTRSACRRR